MKTFSFDDVAEMFDVSARTVGAYVKSGELRAVNVSRDRNSRKPRLRVTQDALDAFIASREAGEPAPQKPPRRRRRIGDVPSYV